MTTDDVLQELEGLTARRADTAAAYAYDDEYWRNGIKAAMRSGATRTAVAAAAGVSRIRVQQIEENRR